MEKKYWRIMEEKALARIEVHLAHYLVENEMLWHPCTCPPPCKNSDISHSPPCKAKIKIRR
jgi:hypothetical protein